MSPVRQLSWDNFLQTVLVPGQERLHRIADDPIIDVFGDGITNRIGVLIHAPEVDSIPSALSRLALVHLRLLEKDGTRFLEVATPNRDIYRPFYYFVGALTERVATDRMPVLEAVLLELESFTQLLSEKSLLGLERELGLLGELLFLELLLTSSGPTAVDAWLGPRGEPHDFRIASREFEIKTTLSRQRIHTINSLDQLIPSPHCQLCLVSIVVGPPGAAAGFSLSDMVDRVRARFTGTSDVALRFNQALKAVGFADSDAVHYTRRFALRRPIALVPITRDFPAITRTAVQQLLGPQASRVGGIAYDVNVEGLEHEEGSPFFIASLSRELA